MSKKDWEKNNISHIFGDLMPKDIESVLDLGCGLSLKSKFIPAQIRVGVDIYDKYFEYIEAEVPYVVIRQDVRKLNIFADKSFDVVIAMDIIEHLTTEEGWRLLIESERIARKAVIIETPEGYIAQDRDITGHGGHKWQTHRSGWLEEELTSFGFKVIKRPYTMDNVKRNKADIEIDPNITLLDAIKCLKY